MGPRAPNPLMASSVKVRTMHGALFLSPPSRYNRNCLDPTRSRLHRTGSAHGGSTRLHQTPFHGSATPPSPGARRRAQRPRPRNPSVAPGRPLAPRHAPVAHRPPRSVGDEARLVEGLALAEPVVGGPPRPGRPRPQ